MDLMMPGINGFEVTREIRQIPVLKNIIIIGMSANVFHQTQQESIAAGCNAFLAKPIDLETLLEYLHVHLKLEWIYEDKSDGCHVGSDVHLSASPEPYLIVSPSIEQLGFLYDLIKMGDIVAFRGQLEAIAALDSKFGPFVAKLNQLSKDFQINKIRKCLEEYLKEKKPGERRGENE
jgi:hypothetical protein